MDAEPKRGDREAEAVVYAVHSRRSGGLSVGIDLFPGGKRCSFDCPYCELFPVKSDIAFNLAAMERGLRAIIRRAADAGELVRDLCFSGSGEPTLSDHLGPALTAAARLRTELVPTAALVLISNGSVLGERAVAATLSAAIRDYDLDLWLKWDAGTEDWYRKIDRAALPYGRLAAGVEAFVDANVVTIQTMLCAVDGAPPPPAETDAWLKSAQRLARIGRIRRFQLYGKARPSPHDPAATPLPAAYLEDRAAALRRVLAADSIKVPVAVYP